MSGYRNISHTFAHIDIVYTQTCIPADTSHVYVHTHIHKAHRATGSHVYMHSHTDAYTIHRQASSHMCIGKFTCIHVNMFIHIHAHMYVNMYTYMGPRIHAHIHVHMHLHSGQDFLVNVIHSFSHSSIHSFAVLVMESSALHMLDKHSSVPQSSPQVPLDYVLMVLVHVFVSTVDLTSQFCYRSTVTAYRVSLLEDNQDPIRLVTRGGAQWQ